MSKNMLSKILSLFLMISLIVPSLSNIAFAKDKSIGSVNIDSYSIDILKNNDNEIEVKTIEDGVEYIVTFDKNSEEYFLKTKEEESFLSKILNEDKIIDTQKIIIEDASEDSVNATVLDGKNKKGFEISENDEELTAQAPLVIGAGAAASALIKAILAIAGTYVIAGATWYVASSVISKLKRDQPEVHYYSAMLHKGKVVIGKALKSKSLAVRRLSLEMDVFAISSGYAYDACKSASPIKQVSARQKHGSGSNHYYHYHPMLKSKTQMDGHCWYI